jgi:hypothetical protein
MNLREDIRVHRGEGGKPQGELNAMKTLMTSLLLAGTALMAAQTGNTPAPAANSSSTTAPAKVKKHHHKKKSADAAAATKSAPASTTPAK